MLTVPPCLQCHHAYSAIMLTVPPCLQCHYAYSAIMLTVPSCLQCHHACLQCLQCHHAYSAIMLTVPSCLQRHHAYSAIMLANDIMISRKFLYRIPFLKYLTWTFQGFDLDLWFLTFDLQKSSDVKNIPDIWDPIQDFLSDFYWHFPSISYRFFYMKIFKVWPWPLTFKGHLRSKIFSPFESPYMTPYLISIDNFSLSRTVLEIFDFKVLRGWPWPQNSKDHLKSKKILAIRKPYLTWLPI